MTSRLTRAAGALLTLTLGAALLTPAPAQATPAAETFDIRVELDLPSMELGGPAVFEAIGVVPGPGPELTDTHLVANPSDWDGHVNVDIDPTTRTIRVGDNPDGWDFETALVRISSSSMGPLTLVSDDLFDTTDPVELTLEGGPGWAEAFWLISDAPDLTGTAVFTWGPLPLLDSATTVQKASYIRKRKTLRARARVTGESARYSASTPPVEGRARVVVLRGKKGTRKRAQKTVTLTPKGIVRAKFTKKLAPGPYRVKVTYLGSSTHAASSDVLRFRVRPVRRAPQRRSS